MKTSVKLMALILAVGLMAGCAGPSKRISDNQLLCSAIGALAGGGVASAAGDNDAAAGALVGAGLGLLLCSTETAPAADVMMAAECTEMSHPDALLDANGCAFDSDNDGVVDGVDLCANTPEGIKVDRVGCALDSDKDGVADYMDSCLGTPRGTIVNVDGCPLVGEKLLSLTGVNFSTNSAVLTADAKDILEEAVTLLRNTETVIEVRVEGHTDNLGSEVYNQQLSQKRAESVVDYLVSRGLQANSLVPVGMGESLPIASNDTKGGRAQNRRVDFVVN